MMKAAGTAYPPPETATGTLNIIAASGAAPVTMQNSTWGNPSALFARPPDSWTGVTADGASVTGLMRPPAADDGPPGSTGIHHHRWKAGTAQSTDSPS